MTARDPLPNKEVQAIHKPFSWLDSSLKNDFQAQFIALTMDVSNGVQTCLQLVHRDMMTRGQNRVADPGHEVAPLLDEEAGERLLLFATAAAQLLSERAESHIDAMHSRAERQAATGAAS